jgi:hypothetical protein
LALQVFSTGDSWMSYIAASIHSVYNKNELETHRTCSDLEVGNEARIEFAKGFADI